MEDCEENEAQRSLWALWVVGVLLVAECVLVLRVGREAKLVLLSSLVSASEVPVVLVCGLWNAAHREEGIGCIADAGLVHGAGTSGCELACLACIGLALVGTVLVGIWECA